MPSENDLSGKVVFNEAITKLGGLKNEIDRDALAMQLFGKSAMNLNSLIKAGGAELKKMADEAKKNGAVMSNDAVFGLDILACFCNLFRALLTTYLLKGSYAFFRL